jgi:hypothetical protein
MNIFATSLSPKESAINLDNKRVVKMVLESMQMLSTAIYFYRGNAPYRPNHLNHPCTIWVRNSRKNYDWLLRHFKYLFKEYNYRYKKHHKCESYYKLLKAGKKFIPNRKSTPIADCTTLPKKYDFLTKIEDRYKQCMVNKWLNDKRKPEWTGRKIPEWFDRFKKYNREVNK